MICPKEKCTGCFACHNICPKNAINMVEDEFGYIYPIIDDKKCINCNLCKKVCPSLNPIKAIYPQKCYAMYAKDKKIRDESTSGGAATIFSTYIIKNGGVVYGATYSKGIINHLRIDNLRDLTKLKGSKYVHSYILDTYKEAKKDLTNNKKVLFIGTPCQIAGLKRYLMKDYDNLYLIDIICHGVPSQKYLKDEIGGNNEKISFRSKEGYVLKLYRDSKLIKSERIDKSPYYSSFMDGMIFRENCYNCFYAKPERISDITIGDFWGLGKDSKLYDYDNSGVSVILPITDKGVNLFEECCDKMIYEERKIEEAINGNTQLRHAIIKPKNYYKFQKIYLKSDFLTAYKKTNKIKILKNKFKNNKYIYGIYKKIKDMTK